MPVKVAPEDIENALSAIWEELEPTSRMRACLFNLIFYTKKTERASYIHKIAQRVISKFPSRILLIVNDSEASDRMETGVSVLHEQNFACDLIEISIGGSLSARIPFLILPHILPDLPVYLVWGEDPIANDPLWQPLKKLASRLIIDSETTQNLSLCAEKLLNEYKPLECEIADLNWARLEGWRELLSRTFYSQERINKLRSTDHIHITYNAKSSAFFTHTHIQALYMQTWLASQLKWSIETTTQTSGTYTSLYKKDKDQVTITLTPVSYTELAPGTLVSIQIITPQKDHFSFTRKPSCLHHIATQISSALQCEMPMDVIFPHTESGHSLTQEMCRPRTSSHYLSVLKNLPNTHAY